MSLTAETIARHLEGEVIGDKTIVLTGFAPANSARPGDLTFAENATFLAKAEQSEATAILVDQDFKSDVKVLIRVPNSRIAFAKVLPLFFPETQPKPGIHPGAVIAASATVDPSAHIGPHVTIGENVSIGADTIVESGVAIGPDSQVGAGCRLHPNVTIYHRTQIGDRVRIHSGTTIGSDGFGYVFDNDSHLKVPQVGNVIIQDDVEIGSNVSIDRGTLGPTTIGRGSKIDNLVQIGHNVQVGEGCIIVAQVGIAGSTRLGNFVTLGGQVGVAGHLKIGDRAMVAAQSGVMHDIPAGEKWFGAPAQSDRKAKRQMLAVSRLPQLVKRVGDLEAWLKHDPARE